MYVCMYVCMWVCMYVCMVCMFVCMHVCMMRACMFAQQKNDPPPTPVPGNRDKRHKRRLQPCLVMARE